MAAKKKAVGRAAVKKPAPVKRNSSGAGRTDPPGAKKFYGEDGRYLYGGATRVSGRAPKAENTISVIDSLIRQGMSGMRSEARTYGSRSEFVSGMTDVLGEGELGKYPGWQWESQAKSTLGQVWDAANKKGKKRK